MKNYHKFFRWLRRWERIEWRKKTRNSKWTVREKKCVHASKRFKFKLKYSIRQIVLAYDVVFHLVCSAIMIEKILIQLENFCFRFWSCKYMLNVFGHPRLSISISIFSVFIERWTGVSIFIFLFRAFVWKWCFWIRSVRHLRDEKMRWEVERNLINHSDN